MTTFERIYIADPVHPPRKGTPIIHGITMRPSAAASSPSSVLPGTSHIVNGHVPVQEKKGESPIKGGGRLVVIDGGFCRAYHDKTGIAGYTLVYSSRTMSLRTHQPFVSAEKAVNEKHRHRVAEEHTGNGEPPHSRGGDRRGRGAAGSACMT